MNISNKILNLSKDGKGQFFKIDDLDKLNELSKFNSLLINYGSPFLILNDEYYEFYWMPSIFILDKITGNYDHSNTAENRLKILNGYKMVEWQNEIKKIGAYKNYVKKGELEIKDLIENIWIEIDFYNEEFLNN